MGLVLFIADRSRLLTMAKERQNRAFRPGTVANQDSLATLYLAFTIYFGFTDVPAREATILSFAEFLLRTYTANKSVTNAISAVKRLHLDCGADVEVFSAPGVERWKRALPLTVRTFPRPAPPLSVGVLEQLCVAAGGGGRRTTTIVALFSILFHSMARLSSLLPLTAGAFDLTRHAAAEDCSWVGGRLWFRVKWSKTQQRTEQAFWVPLLPREGSPACPVEALRRLRGGAAPQRGSPLFCGAPGVALSIPVARQWLRVILRCIGLSADAFTFHSFRRGACTAAFASGAHLEDLKALGGWRSDAVARYRSPADARLRAAQALGEGGRGGPQRNKRLP